MRRDDGGSGGAKGKVEYEGKEDDINSVRCYVVATRRVPIHISVSVQNRCCYFHTSDSRTTKPSFVGCTVICPCDHSIYVSAPGNIPIGSMDTPCNRRYAIYMYMYIYI